MGYTWVMEDHENHSTYKTRIDIPKVESFLSQKYPGGVSNLEFIKGGEVAQAFSFETGSEKYILRISSHGTDGFEKDKFAHEHFNTESLPIPEILEIGTVDDKHHFAISKKAEGKTLYAFSDKEFAELAPESLIILDRIHKINIEGTTGYGYWSIEGKGQHNSWRDVIKNAGTEGSRKWEDLFANTFMEKDLYEKLYAKLQDLSRYCPEERYLFHGDYGYDNVLSDGKKITGVIDWSESRYGDFLYDAAWMMFWPSPYDLEPLFREHYDNSGMLIRNYDERIMCYQIFIALNSLGFYAESNQKDKYEWAKKRIWALTGIK
jgi:hygromycin-B 4-O-kinase